VEINANHQLIVKINTLRKTDSSLASLIAKTLLDQLLANASVPFNIQEANHRTTQLMERAAELRLTNTNTEHNQPRVKRAGKKGESVLSEAKNVGQTGGNTKATFVINEKGEPIRTDPSKK
jgi:hypothetical protein